MPVGEVAGPLFDMLRAGDAAGAEAAAWLLGYCATDSVARRTLSDAGAASALMPVGLFHACPHINITQHY